jgi:hypothetical protein
MDRDRDRDDDRSGYSGRELGGYRSAHSQDRDDRGRFAGHDDRGYRDDRSFRDDRGMTARGRSRDNDWSSQSQRGDRDDVCPNCGYAMSDYGDRDRNRDQDRYGIRTSDRYDRGDRYDRSYDRGDRDRSPTDRYDYSAGNRPRGIPDEGYGTWGSDRERGYATSSRNTSGWNRDEYDGRGQSDRWRGDDYR